MTSLSEYIEILQEALEEHGDLELYTLESANEDYYPFVPWRYYPVEPPSLQDVAPKVVGSALRETVLVPAGEVISKTGVRKVLVIE